MDNHGHKNRTCICTLSTPSGNRTRVSPVAGAYSTTRPTVSEAVSPPSARCCLHNFWESIWPVCARFHFLCRFATFRLPLFSIILGMEMSLTVRHKVRLKLQSCSFMALYVVLVFSISTFSKRNLQALARDSLSFAGMVS